MTSLPPPSVEFSNPVVTFSAEVEPDYIVQLLTPDGVRLGLDVTLRDGTIWEGVELHCTHSNPDSEWFEDCTATFHACGGGWLFDARWGDIARIEVC